MIPLCPGVRCPGAVRLPGFFCSLEKLKQLRSVAAKCNGKRFGRPEKKMPDQFKEICQKCKNGEVSTRQAADILGISHTTFYRRYRKEVEENVSNSRHFGTSE